jgi:hypothetical protein
MGIFGDYTTNHPIRRPCEGWDAHLPRLPANGSLGVSMKQVRSIGKSSMAA